RLEAGQIKYSLQLGRDHLVHANAMVLEQIVVNLLTNAIDALAGRDDARIEIRMGPAGAESDNVVLSIEDNGSGMSDDQLNRVFEPFFTTKPMGQGLGLGLAISYSLACDIGADLTVKSRVGEGTCFSLTIKSAENERWKT
ncbi:MAG: ATP-binding protein, partial [Marinobacter sp.]|nr:ATP-binding protein [Marinobacter sp.]